MPVKKLIGIVLFSIGCSVASAQQRPQYTQYVFNNFLLNPAVSGIENYIDVKGGYRSQWRGLDGAPETSYFSINAPLGKNFLYDNANSFPESGGNPMGRSYLQNYTAAAPHHGIGFHAVIDKAGPINRTDLNATYAYHIGISDQVNIAVGVSAGISRISLDVSKITLENSIDPAIASNANQEIKPDLGAGIWIYGPRFFAGVSAQQISGESLSFTDDETYNLGKEVPHYFITAGYKAMVTEDIAAIPSLMVKYVSPSPASVDVNLKLAFRDKFWLGGSYRKNDSFSGILGFNVSSLFSLGYSYDFTTSDLGSVSSGSHEIVLGLLLNNRYKVTCPQHNW
jgi:type IX secretion system PorP/SprF family membrane protein